MSLNLATTFHFPHAWTRDLAAYSALRVAIDIANAKSIAVCETLPEELRDIHLDAELKKASPEYAAAEKVCDDLWAQAENLDKRWSGYLYRAWADLSRLPSGLARSF